MKLSIIYNKYLKYIIWFVILMSISFLVSLNLYEKTKQSYDENKFAEINEKLNLVLRDFNVHSDLIITSIQHNPKFINLLKQIKSKYLSDDVFRKQIDQEISKFSINLTDLGISKFNIIRSNKTVFYRYYEKEKYDDDLSFRNLLNIVATTNQPQSEFSLSVLDYSYRRIYPIIIDSELVCFIETGSSEKFLSESFSFDNSRISIIHFNSDQFSKHSPKNITESPLVKGMYISLASKKLLSKETAKDLVDKHLSRYLAKESSLNAKLASRTHFNYHFLDFTHIYSIYFIPVFNNNNIFSGYFVHGFKNKTLESNFFDFIILNIALSLFLIILLYSIAFRQKSIGRLEQKIFELQKEKNKSTSLIEDLNKSQKELKEKADFAIKINNLLHEQETLLRKTLDEKNRFFSILAHDIKNPITSLYTNAELLTIYYDKMDENEKKEIAKRLLSSSKTLDRLVHDLLEWGRLQLGKYNVELKEIVLKDEIDKIIETYNDNTRVKGNLLENHLPLHLKITSDPHIVRTIFRNLIQNSIKFTENGHISIEVLKQQDSTITFAVKDTGVGIPQEKIQDLFHVDKAFTTKGTRDEVGTGLGLILVNDYLKKIEGTISVESKIGVGTTFFITLPK